MKIDDFNKETFIEVYNKYFENIFSFCVYKTGNKEVSIDISQQTFMNLWNYFRRGDKIENPKALVYHIANNFVIDWYRKKKPTSLDILEEKGFNPRDINHDDSVIKNAEFEHTMQSLDKLSMEEHRLIMWKYIDDFSIKEIAEIINKKENVIYVKIHRALKHLKNIIKKSKEEL